MTVTRTFSEAFDELFNFAKELYHHPHSLRPSMKKEKLPLELFMKGVRILLSLTPQDNIQTTTKNQTPIRTGKKHSLETQPPLQRQHNNLTQREAFKTEKR